MQIDCHLKVIGLEVIHELAWVREEAFVPCPSGPSATAGISVMPVHVDNEHIERDIICMELVHESSKFLVCIGPVAGPPISECESWRERHLAGKDCEVLKGSLVVMSICHEIPILALPFRSFCCPCPVRVVKEKIV